MRPKYFTEDGKDPRYQRFRTFVELDGERLSLDEACRRKRITRQAVHYHRKKGLNTQEAFEKVVSYYDR